MTISPIRTIAAVLCLSLLSGAALAADQVKITVNKSSGTATFTAPVVGQTPVTLERAMQSGGVSFTATWFPSVPGYAAMIIDGEPATTTGQFGTPFWWACINEYSAAAGLQTLVKAGDAVTWKFVTDGKCPKDN